MKLTIFKQLLIGNLIVLSFVVLLGAYVVYKLDKLYRLSMEIVEIDNRSVALCENLSASLSSLIMLEKKYIISKDADYFEKYKELKSVFEKDLSFLLTLLKSDEIKQSAIEAKVLFQNHVKGFDSQAAGFIQEDASKEGVASQKSDPSAFLKEKEIQINEVESKVLEIIQAKNTKKNSKIVLTSSMIDNIIKLTIIITIIAIVLGFAISVASTKLITSSIFLLETKTREISKGQFNQIEPISAAPKEIDDLTRHFNVMCERLKELEVMKTDFISHFSHELRTPITSIKEASSMLNMQLFKQAPEKEKELSQLILTECERLIASIEKILDLSRMEVFQMDYSFRKADIMDVIRKSLVKFVPEAQNKKIDLKLLPGKTIPPCRMDVKRIEEVINNLVSNALKYTHEQGKILIGASMSVNKQRVIVSVADNGCGIDKKNLERIFEKFKRIDKGNQTLRGTGLGLAISKHIIKAHKGEIWAESEPFRGTKISFILPAA